MVGRTVTCAARDITPVTYKPVRVLPRHDLHQAHALLEMTALSAQSVGKTILLTTSLGYIKFGQFAFQQLQEAAHLIAQGFCSCNVCTSLPETLSVAARVRFCFVKSSARCCHMKL